MTFLSSYTDRESTLKCQSKINTNDGRTGRVHSLNDFDVTVWDDGTVTAKRKYYASSEPRKHLPNMEVREGRIIIAIEDLVGEILARITPLELAEGIISDDEARERMIECLCERYASPGFSDEDRRKWLKGVQAEIHDVQLDKIVSQLNELEQHQRSKASFYRWKRVEVSHYMRLYRSALAKLQMYANEDAVQAFINMHTQPEKLQARLEADADPIVVETAGPQWHESRDYWRKELLKLFEPPTS